MFRRLATLLALAAGTAAAADAPHPLAPLDTSSPRSTYTGFLDAAERAEQLFIDYGADKSRDGAEELAEAMQRSERAFDLSAVPPAQRAEMGAEAGVHLTDILLRLPALDPEAIPGHDAAEPVQRWTIPSTEIVIERMAEGPRSGEYLFTAETVARLPEFHARIIDLPPLRESAVANWDDALLAITGPLIPDSLTEALPAPLQRPLLGSLVWKVVLTTTIWAAIAGVVLATTLAQRGREARGLRALAVQMIAPLLLLGLAWGAHRFTVAETSVSGLFSEIEVVVATAAIYGALAWATLLACMLVVELVIALPAIPDQSYDAHLLRLVARVGGMTGAAAVLLYGGNQIGIPALGLLAGMGFGGLALALAGQRALENLLGGFSILMDRPFRVGDFIDYGGATGSVESIGPRSSRLRGLDGTLTTVPNTDLATAHVVNFSLRERCLFLHEIGLRFTTTRAQVEAILDAIRGRLDADPMVEKSPGMPRVRLIRFSAGSIDIEIRANVPTSDFGRFLQVQEALLLDIQDIIERNGSAFALPSQAIVMDHDAPPPIAAAFEGRAV